MPGLVPGILSFVAPEKGRRDKPADDEWLKRLLLFTFARLDRAILFFRPGKGCPVQAGAR